MTVAADAMVAKGRGVSLKDVGFVNVGLDDYYQACGTGVQGSFHNASGYPLIDATKFPSMKAMTDHAHSLGLRMGWYANNCGCNEHQNVSSWGPPQTTGKLPFGKGPLTDGLYHYQQEVQATIDFGFDGIKLDGCGEFLNLTVFAELLNKTGKPILIENCHWGRDGPGDWGDGGSLNRGINKVPADKWCPFNFFRTSGDINAHWDSVIHNLLTVDQHQPWNGTPDQIRTGPGCWAYPDMLEVGNLASFNEDRSHFGAWVINSAPLILGHDLANSAVNDKIWPIITNKAAIAVSQSFEKRATPHPGGLVGKFNPSPPDDGTQYLWGEATKSGGWKVPAAGAPGPLEHGPSGLCIDPTTASSQGEQYKVTKCSGDASQNFVLEANGNLHAASGSKLCIAIENFEGPGVVSYSCNTGENEEMIVGPSDGSLCSKGSSDHAARCLNVHPTPPAGDGGMLLYAKPQPAGAVAVLVINNSAKKAALTFSLADVRCTHSGAVNVMDVWEQKQLAPLPAGTGTFTTDAFEAHDSRFYVFSPQ